MTNLSAILSAKVDPSNLVHRLEPTETETQTGARMDGNQVRV